MKINPAKVFLSVSMGLLFAAAFAPIGTDDPPKKKSNKKDTILIQQAQRSLDLDELNRMFDSINAKQDTLIKKK